MLTRISSLYGTAYQFSKKFFTGWVIVSLLWAFFSFGSVTLYPIFEERRRVLSWVKSLHKDNSIHEAAPETVEADHGEKYTYASVISR